MIVFMMCVTLPHAAMSQLRGTGDKDDIIEACAFWHFVIAVIIVNFYSTRNHRKNIESQLSLKLCISI